MRLQRTRRAEDNWCRVWHDIDIGMYVAELTVVSALKGGKVT